jgi:hypothetical protein
MLRKSRFPTVLGICADNISLVAAAANECMERLIIDPLAPDEGWWGGSATMVFVPLVTNYTATIIAPQEVARVIVLDICNRPRMLRNRFYEYLQLSRGLQPPPCNQIGCALSEAYERDNSVTLNPFPTTGPQTIRIYPVNSADVGQTVIVQGTDQNGLTVYGVDPTTGFSILGETVILQLPFAQSVNLYNGLTALIKSPTLGPVQFFAVDANGNQTALTTMAPNEPTAGYRTYLLSSLPPNCCNTPTGQVTVSAQCKLDFVPVASDSDFLSIPNIPAIIEEGESIRYSRMDNAKAAALAQQHHRTALGLLCGQIDHYEGKTQTAVRVPIFGSRGLRPQPV